MKKNLTMKISLIRALLITLLLNLSLGLSAQQKMGDNLGTHVATKDLKMNAKNIVNAAGLVIGSASFTNPNVILDINSLSKVMVIPRITNINTLTGTIDNGSMAYDVATNKFYIRENNTWSSFGDFSLASGQVMLGNASNRAVAVALSGDVTVSPLGVTTIGEKKVTVDKMGSAGTADANKVFGTNVSTGNPELISRTDLAIPKYTQIQRDALTNVLNNYLIFNTTNRQLQIYDIALPGWVALGSAPASSLPTVSTNQPGVVAEPDRLSITGNVSSTGGFNVTSRGIAYSLTTSPTISNFSSNDPGITGSGIGSFTLNIVGLSSNTTYYARAYAINSVGISYGNEIMFTTAAASVPVVTTINPGTNITSTSVTSGGNVTSIKGAAVTARGIVVGTTATPTIDNALKTSDGSGIGTFTSQLSGLNASTSTYRVRAYATNSAGTGYGEAIQFTTPAATIPVVASTAEVIKSGQSQTSGGNITSNGGAAITNYGVVWSTTSTRPTTLTSSNSNSGNTGTVGSFTIAINSVLPNTNYYVWAFATNTAGTAYAETPVNFTSNGPPVPGPTVVSANTVGSVTIQGSITNDGGLPITEKGFVYGTTSLPTLGGSGDATLAAGTGAAPFSNTLTTLAPGTTYYVRSYAKNSIGGPIYGNQVSFTTAQTGSISWTTAGSRNWTVPAGVTTIRVVLAGGRGGNGRIGSVPGGLGGIVSGNLAVNPGDVIYVFVGGQGTNSVSSGPIAAGGFNGGGGGGSMNGSQSDGAAGGGASDIRIGGTTPNNRVIVAGGGGGADMSPGGNGGGIAGGNGVDGGGTYNNYYSGGGGGTQTTGGAPGFSSYGTAGRFGSGGTSVQTNGPTSGGGGGWYGGGAGYQSGGGGGSGYIGGVISGTGSFDGSSTTAAGSITITW
jgi:hypothetical protein